MADEKNNEEYAGTQVAGLAPDEVDRVAEKIRKAMKGFGTDEGALIDAITPLNYVQVAQVVEAYNKKFDRDIIKDVKSECGGSFEDVLVALLTHPATLDARIVKKSIKGLGTDEDLLIESVLSKYDWELKATHEAYRKEYNDLMQDEIESDCGGDLKKVLRTVLTKVTHGGRDMPPDSQIEDDIIRLYNAGQNKIGTNEKVFIDILGNNQRTYIYKLADAYGKKYGRPLTKVIKDEMGGKLEKALLALVTPLPEYYSNIIYKAMKGMGSDEETMIRIIVTQRDKHLKAICAHFLKEHEKSLAKWVEGEVGGDFKKALVSIIEKHGQ